MASSPDSPVREMGDQIGCIRDDDRKSQGRELRSRIGPQCKRSQMRSEAFPVAAAGVCLGVDFYSIEGGEGSIAATAGLGVERRLAGSVVWEPCVRIPPLDVRTPAVIGRPQVRQPGPGRGSRQV